MLSGLTLPNALEVGGKFYDIRSGFLTVLRIFEAFSDPELDLKEKAYVCVECLYKEPELIPGEFMQEAVEKAFWFVGGGEIPEAGDSKQKNIRTIDWEKDRKYILPAISHVLGVPDVRALPELHWWTFYSAFCELPEESTLARLMDLRYRMGEGKLTKEERAFVRKHREIVMIRTPEEQAEIDETEAFLKELTEQ